MRRTAGFYSSVNVSRQSDIKAFTHIYVGYSKPASHHVSKCYIIITAK